MTSAGMECQDNCLNDTVYCLIDNIVRAIISKSYENPDIFRDCLERFRTELAAIHHPPGEIPDEQEFEPCPEVSSLEVDGSNHEDEHDQGLLPEEAQFHEEEEIILESSKSTQSPQASAENSEDDHTQSIQHDSNTTQESFLPVEGLKIGQWVEFVGEGNQHRLNCKLAHIDKHTNRYIFENRSGMKVAECDGKHLLDGIKNGLIIIQTDIQIFDRALQAVFEKFKKH